MPKFIDLTGQKFNRLTVLYRLGKISPVTWVCKCDCGNICNIRSSNLTNGHTKSCGCLQKEKTKEMGLNNINDLTGKKFNYLTVLTKSTKKQGNNWKWICQCDCGKIKEVAGGDLIKGNIKSCGCKKSELISQNNTISMVGKKFGKLTVLQEISERASDGSIKYLCKCECGNTKIINGVNLRRGITTSCGCINYSIGEKNINNILMQNNIPFIQEYQVSNLNNKRFDFAILNQKNQIIRFIEFDGRQHFEKYWNQDWENNCPLEIRQQRDEEKNNYCKQNNIPLVRIPYIERDNITLEMIMGDQYLVK